MTFHAEPPVPVGFFDVTLPEVMYYLYLPVMMTEAEAGPEPWRTIRLPDNVERCRGMIMKALEHAPCSYKYAYLSARKGWATPDNPLNRPGWHCDGFGTDDMNYVWWNGPGTRFTYNKFIDISDDHIESMRQFDEQAGWAPEHMIYSPPAGGLYALTPRVVHATPQIGHPGCMRQYVKVSLSDQRYNLENNSHNYLFDYDWPLHSRDVIRNDLHKSQRDAA